MTHSKHPLRIVAITGSLGVAMSAVIAAVPGGPFGAEARLEYVRALAQKGVFELFWRDETGPRARVKQFSQKYNKIDPGHKPPPKEQENPDREG
jgi:hypothetical protein